MSTANLQIAAPVQNIEIQKVDKQVEKLSTEEYIRKYFSDEPVLIEVARCESQFRQTDKRGVVLRGEVNDQDIGAMQINNDYHGIRSDKLGLDIYTLEGNLKYARNLFDREGLKPWRSSSPCWKKSQAYSNYQEKIELALAK